MESPVKGNPNADIIDSIISIEQGMFDKVLNIGGRASCQDDHATFYIMRCCQYLPWDRPVLESWEADLKKAEEEGQNLVELKYAYMTGCDDPEYYEKNLAPFIPAVSGKKSAAADAVMDCILPGFREAAEKYPAFTSRGRPENGNTGASFSVYMRCELLTYSENTLALFLEMQRNKARARICYACEVYENTAKFYGFAGLEEAESALTKAGSRGPAV